MLWSCNASNYKVQHLISTCTWSFYYGSICWSWSCRFSSSFTNCLPHLDIRWWQQLQRTCECSITINVTQHSMTATVDWKCMTWKWRTIQITVGGAKMQGLAFSGRAFSALPISMIQWYRGSCVCISVWHQQHSNIWAARRQGHGHHLWREGR